MSEKLTREMIEEDVRSFLDNFKASIDRLRKSDAERAQRGSEEEREEAGEDIPTKQADPKLLQRAKSDLLQNANIYADNGYSSKGLETNLTSDLPTNGGITYSEPLAYAMYTSVVATGMIEAKPKAYNVFIQKFNSDKKFANKTLEVSRPAFDSISRGMFQALVDYGQGFGPKNKDGTPIKNEYKTAISLSTLKAIVKEQLEKALRKQRS